jgi:predicted metal-dependent enzyme (double-stranded beta helix superfamily)
MYDDVILALVDVAKKNRGYGDEVADAMQTCMTKLRPILADEDPRLVTYFRKSAHTEGSRVLYYDGSLGVVFNDVKAGSIVPIHNHGLPEVVGVYSGSILYRTYNRLDDGEIPNVAKLSLREERVMTDGDVSVLPEPPNDIHGLRALMDTRVMNIIPGALQPIRQYYYPSESIYIELPAGTKPADGGGW